jgi:cytoplasmic iron level regulating protein YaaA (DUF328/UPF0246 family)
VVTVIAVLLPPSEGKSSGGDGRVFDPYEGAFGALGAGRRKVVKALRARAFDATRELGVSGASLLAAMNANKAIAGAATCPALRRYTGVLYDALAYPTLSPQLQAALDRDVVIVSGLLGVVAGGDAVPPYKLPIGARLPDVGRLAAFWKPRIAPQLGRHVDGAVVWDLLPGAHAAAVPAQLGRIRWRVTVLRERDGRRATVSHDNKAVKGALARVLVAEQLTDPAALDGWEGPGGYRVDAVRGEFVEIVTRD